MKGKYSLIAPSGKTIQQKINSILKGYVVYSQNTEENHRITEEEVKKSIKNVLDRCILVNNWKA